MSDKKNIIRQKKQKNMSDNMICMAFIMHMTHTVVFCYMRYKAVFAYKDIYDIHDIYV